MKITIDRKEKKIEEEIFPKLKISETGNIALFINKNQGFYVHIEDKHSAIAEKLFERVNSFRLSGFEDFKGSVTFSSE